VNGHGQPSARCLGHAVRFEVEKSRDRGPGEVDVEDSSRVAKGGEREG